MNDRHAVLGHLDAFARLIATRDLAIVDALWTSRGFVLLGSEQGERADSREALVALFEALFAKPYALSFAWKEPEVTIAGDIAWVTAEGTMSVVHADRAHPMPYRTVAIFERTAMGWAWRLFSGSEPAPPPPP